MPKCEWWPSSLTWTHHSAPDSVSEWSVSGKVPCLSSLSVPPRGKPRALLLPRCRFFLAKLASACLMPSLFSGERGERGVASDESGWSGWQYRRGRSLVWKSKIDLTNFSRSVVGLASAGSQKVPACEASILELRTCSSTLMSVASTF